MHPQVDCLHSRMFQVVKLGTFLECIE